MGVTIKMDELRKISYLQLGDLQGRSVPLFACYHGDDNWELWLPNEGSLQLMRPTMMAEGKYFGKAPHSQSDVYITFFDFMCKRAYWSEIVPFIEGIYDDLQNFGASLAKLDLCFKGTRSKPIEGNRFVITELEYLFSACRSLYDLLQECLATMWPRFKFYDQKYGKRVLPSSFRKMLMKGDKLLTASEIVERYCIPEDLAQFYVRQATFFQWLREYRDFVSHSGKSFDLVFSTEKGFAVSIETKPFSSMDIWSTANTRPHKLGSVRSLTAHLILSTLSAIEEFAVLMSQLIIFPPDIAPDYKVFICGAHTARLQNLETLIGESAWRD